MPFDSLPVLDEVDLTLRTARELIEQGWCKGQLHLNQHEKHCTAGAIRMAAGWKTGRLHNLAIQRFARSLPSAYQINSRSAVYAVMTWNDVTSRTKGQVLAQFDRVISDSFGKRHPNCIE